MPLAGFNINPKNVILGQFAAGQFAGGQFAAGNLCLNSHNFLFICPIDFNKQHHFSMIITIHTALEFDLIRNIMTQERKAHFWNWLRWDISENEKIFFFARGHPRKSTFSVLGVPQKNDLG